MRAALIILVWLTGGIAVARPGKVLPDRFPSFSKQGTVYAAEVAEDGSVFMVGDFTEVNGVARPGIAKLTANGELDVTFEPTEKVAATLTFDLLPREPVTPYRQGPQWRVIELLPLFGGGVMIKNPDSWELRDANGEINWVAMPELPRSGTERAMPLISVGERLLMLNRAGVWPGEISAYSGAGFTLDESFQSPPGVWAMARAGEGRLWAVGRIAVDESGDLVRLIRLNSDGSIDTVFYDQEWLSSGALRAGLWSRGRG